MSEGQTKRSTLNLRPKGQPDAQGYSPHRDLAYVYPAMMREAFATLDEACWTDEFREQMRKSGIREDDLAEGVGKFVEALNLFIREPDIKTPADAFRSTGFDVMDSYVKNVLWTRFGEVLTGGWFVAVRDVTLRGSMSDAADVMADMLTAGRIVAMGLTEHGHRQGKLTLAVSDNTVNIERLKTDKLELQRVLKQSQSDLRYMEEKYRGTEATLREYAAMESSLEIEKGHRQRAMIEKSNMERELFYVQTNTADTMSALQSWVAAPFLSRLYKGVGILLKAMIRKEAFNVTPDTDPVAESYTDSASISAPD